ncbi:MAG: hypothetical protein COA69_09455 [Robiginitomaculum sp.]|nr:MAG: hypothetical protein COA69_09455 [Robiginitomaculum sp.]
MENNATDDLIQTVINEISMIPSSLMAQVVGDDKETVRSLLHQASLNTVGALAGDENAAEELSIIHATLNDISLKYGIRARIAIEETVNRFVFRLVNVALDAAIPG